MRFFDRYRKLGNFRFADEPGPYDAPYGSANLSANQSLAFYGRGWSKRQPNTRLDSTHIG
jgi:hypothetical protein